MSEGTRVELAPELLDDLDRVFDQVIAFNDDPIAAAARVQFILDGLALLRHSPEIGRPLNRNGMRELVIGRGAQGYLARYRYLAEADVAIVLAVRAQRERDYRR